LPPDTSEHPGGALPAGAATTTPRVRSGTRLIVGLVGLGVLAVAVVALRTGGEGPGEGATRGEGTGAARVGAPAPPVEGRTLDGRTVELSRFAGRPVVVNFWASWCYPCREELPMLTEARAEHRGLVVLGVLLRDIPRDARRFARTHGVTWPTVVDPDGRIAERYGVRSAPATMLIRPDGRIAARFYGVLTRAQLDAALAEIGS